MACKYCDPINPGGYECPICKCDYCKEHYEQYVTDNWYKNERRIENDICLMCGDELQMTEFDQKKFNIHVVRCFQDLLEQASSFSKPLMDDFNVISELLWTYDPEYNSSIKTKKKETK